MNYPLFSGLIEKKTPRNIYKRTLDKRFEWDWLVGLCAMLGDDHTENKKNLVSGIFPGQIDSVMLLGFVSTIKPQNFIKIVRAIFWENPNV